MAGADDAITQGFNALQARDDAQQAMVSFIVDLALAGIPLDKAKGAVADVLGEVFGNPRVSDALKGVSGGIIDSATGRLTTEAKEALTGALGTDEAELLDQQGASNALREALSAGIDDQDRLGSVQDRAEIIAAGINIWRK